MDVDPEDDPSVHRLEASAPTTGGLVIKSKTSTTFKVPMPSLLGLDRLAAQKRKEREETKRLISFKDSEYDDVSGTPKVSSDGTPVRTPDQSSVHKLSRQFREPLVETPTHSGGVSEKARLRLVEHSEKDRRGIAISSKDKKRSRRDQDDDRNRRDRHDGRHGRGRDRYSDRSEHRHRSRSESERSLHTPRSRDGSYEPRTPRSGRGSGTSSASWDDDDERGMSSHRSAWDNPTPRRNEKNRPEWSTRSGSSKYKPFKNVDDTPRPTPAHKYNAWANDRKQTGATPHTGKFAFILLFS